MENESSVIDRSTKFSEFLKAVDEAVSKMITAREFREISENSPSRLLARSREMTTVIDTYEPCISAVVVDLPTEFEYLTARGHYSNMLFEERQFLPVMEAFFRFDLQNEKNPDRHDFMLRWSRMAQRFGKSIPSAKLLQSAFSVRYWHDPKRWYSAMLEKLVDLRTEETLLMMCTISHVHTSDTSKDKCLFLMLEALDQCEAVPINS